jgi:hypothetical protein
MYGATFKPGESHLPTQLGETEMIWEPGSPNAEHVTSAHVFFKEESKSLTFAATRPSCLP